MILDIILIQTNNEISHFKCFSTEYDGNFGGTLIDALLNNFVFSAINIKVSAFVIHLFEFNFNSCMEYLLTNYRNEDLIAKKHDKRIRIYFLLTLLTPSLQIDILKFVKLFK